MKSCAVIIPVLNGEKFICETIDSLLNQTYLPDEIIVVDNGSTDNTLKVLEKYRENIIIITELNKGIAAARNAGIKFSKSKLIAFMDADDICIPTKIKSQIKLFEKDQSIAMAFSSYQYMDVSGALYEGEVHCSQYVNKGFFGLLLERNQIATPTVMVKKNVLKQAGYFDESFLSNAEDYDLWLQISSKYKIFYQNEVSVYVRIHENSSSTNRKDQLTNSIKAIKKFTMDEIKEAISVTYKDKNQAMISLIKILFFIKKYEKAKLLLLKLLQTEMLLPEVYFMLGNISIKKGQLNEAKKFYDQCIQENSQYAEAYNNLGVIYAINNNYSIAQKMFKKALSEKPYYYDPLRNIKIMDKNNFKWHYTFIPLRDVLKPSEF